MLQTGKVVSKWMPFRGTAEVPDEGGKTSFDGKRRRAERIQQVSGYIKYVCPA